MPIFTTFPRLQCYPAALLALALLAGPAAAAPSTGTHPPVAKRPPASASKPKAALPASRKQVAAPVTAAIVAPVASEPPTAPAAPQTVQLKGIVLTSTGRPCAGASVYPAGAPRQLVVTDAQGAFTLPVLVGEAVSLRVEYFGEGSSRVEVPAPGTQPLRITLGQ